MYERLAEEASYGTTHHRHDLGKAVFQLVRLNLRVEVVVRKKFSRTQLLRFTPNVRVKLIGMEACGGAHFLGRALREQGHEVRLIPAQYVKPDCAAFFRREKSLSYCSEKGWLLGAVRSPQ